jgi:hypothetical protein
MMHDVQRMVNTDGYALLRARDALPGPRWAISPILRDGLVYVYQMARLRGLLGKSLKALGNVRMARNVKASKFKQ